jgi:hypothetical protein
MSLKKSRVSLRIILGFCIVGLSILAACSGSKTPEPSLMLETQEVQVEEIPQTEIPIETVSPTNIMADEVYPAPTLDQENKDPNSKGYPAPIEGSPPADSQNGGYSEPEEGYPPPVKTELEASDPSSVNLASGEIQLVEFFAFW